MAVYQKLTYPNSPTDYPVQVQSAIEDEDGLSIKENYAKKTEVAKPGVILTNISIASSDWVAGNSDFVGFPYRADVVQLDVTADMYAAVTYSNTDAASGNYAPSCQTHDGGIYLYSKTNTAITVPSIMVNSTLSYFDIDYSLGDSTHPIYVENGKFKASTVPIQKGITISASAPTGGVDGDIWIQY